jgi:hypothetical protein
VRTSCDWVFYQECIRASSGSAISRYRYWYRYRCNVDADICSRICIHMHGSSTGPCSIRHLSSDSMPMYTSPGLQSHRECRIPKLTSPRGIYIRSTGYATLSAAGGTRARAGFRRIARSSRCFCIHAPWTGQRRLYGKEYEFRSHGSLRVHNGQEQVYAVRILAGRSVGVMMAQCCSLPCPSRLNASSPRLSYHAPALHLRTDHRRLAITTKSHLDAGSV